MRDKLSELILAGHYHIQRIRAITDELFFITGRKTFLKIFKIVIEGGFADISQKFCKETEIVYCPECRRKDLP